MSAASVAGTGGVWRAEPAGRCEGATRSVTSTAMHPTAASTPQGRAVRGSLLLIHLLQAMGPVAGGRRSRHHCPSAGPPAGNTFKDYETSCTGVLSTSVADTVVPLAVQPAPDTASLALVT